MARDEDDGALSGGQQRRAERRKRAARAARREQLARFSRPVALVLAVAVGLAGVVWGIPALARLSWSQGDSDCPVHEHATFKIVVRNETLSFRHPRFDMSNMVMRAHLHYPDDTRLHLEGGCANVREFFGFMGMELRVGSLRLDNTLHEGVLLKDGPNETLRFFLSDPEGNWTERPDAMFHQLRDRERLLVMYGNHTDEQIVAFQRMVPFP